jgi:hypothetical protein
MSTEQSTHPTAATAEMKSALRTAPLMMSMLSSNVFLAQIMGVVMPNIRSHWRPASEH